MDLASNKFVICSAIFIIQKKKSFLQITISE